MARGRKCLVVHSESEAGKASRKVMRVFGRVDFVPAHQIRGQAVILTHTKERARIKKGKAKEMSLSTMRIFSL